MGFSLLLMSIDTLNKFAADLVIKYKQDIVIEIVN